MEGLEKKLADAVKEINASLEEKMAQLEEAQKTGLKAEDLEGLKDSIAKSKEDLDTAVEAQQKQMDELATEFKKAQDMVVASEKATKDPIAVAVKENFDAISTVAKGSPFELMVKDMTLGSNLTGDQPRDYNNNTVIRPPQFTNAEDLMRTIPITGGTYTFNRMSLAANNILLNV